MLINKGYLKGLALFAGSFCIVSSLTSCATYQGRVQEARDLMARGKAEEAAKKLEPLANKDNDDQLVYMLDYATALQEAGDYKQSTDAFARSEKIADIHDYTSLSRAVTSTLVSEELTQYKGDDYEKVFINVINAINYLMMGELDDATVEVRKVNQKLYKYKYEAKRDYEQNPFAFYLNAMIWEAGRKWDDAYIDYKNAYALVPEYTPLHEDLVRSAIRAQRPEDVKDWLTKFPEVRIKPEWTDPSMGELVLIMQQGWGPRKRPRQGAHQFPQLIPVHSFTQYGRLDVDGQAMARSKSIFSVEKVAIKTLDDAYATLIAKRVTGIAAKAVVADQIRQKNQLLGAVAWIALNAADRADLRQWSTLPETLQIARVYLKAGMHKVSVHGMSGGGGETGESYAEREINILPGHKTFISWRSLR